MFRAGLNQIGDWDLRLTSSTPQRIRDHLGRWGWLWVTPRLGATQATVQQVVDSAWYAGIARGPVWHRDDTITLKGWGLGWLLGDPDGVGPQTIPLLGTRDVSEVIGLLNAAEVFNGLTVYPYPTDELPWLMGTSYHEALRPVPSGFHQVISWASRAGGIDFDWTVEPSGLTWLAPGLEFGVAAGPRVLCSTMLSAPDRLADGIVGLPAAVEWDETESDLVTRAQVHTPGELSNPAVTSSLAESLRPRRYLSDEAMDLTWWAERPDQAVGTPAASSRAYAARRRMTDRDLISVWVWGRPDIPRLCRPGRSISVYGPRQRVYGHVAVAHQGAVSLPLDTRVEGLEFGFRPEEMDAWWTPNHAGLPTDVAYRLTEWAPPETAEVRLDVAAPVRPALARASARRRG